MLEIDLKNRVALVLGGSRGIGAAITECLCSAGAYTVFTHTGKPRNKERISSLLARIAKAGGSARAEILDARDSAGTTALVDRIVAAQKKIEVLVANVGQNVARPAGEVSDGDWRDAIEINLSAAFYGVRAVLPHMLKARYGRIILVGSSAVYDGGGGDIGYASAKAGLTGMMQYLNKAHARDGVITNIVHPCVIDTDLLRERYADEATREKLAAQIPVGRLGTPEDIGALVAYLASPRGDYVCGQAILADGGRTLFGK
jgi:NAD(P)-dependent dehydrogenase (short-subunit alcohol dehydrogenase family)